MPAKTPFREIKRGTKFEFADGLRAIAAISVAIYHASLFTGLSGDVATHFPLLSKLLSLGNLAVPLFIVLSGFVLMLPIARSTTLELRGGIRGYVSRRAKRILPPYFFAVALSLALIACIPILQTPMGTAWDNKVPVTADGLVAHVFLLHNLRPDWIYQINGPTWSVATEWQLYFALPFLLLPVWRRFGPWASAVFALALGTAVAFLIPPTFGAHFWFFGLFAMGAVAAYCLTHSRWRADGRIAAALLFCAMLFALWSPNVVVSEIGVGAALAYAIYWLADRTIASKETRVHKVLEHPRLVAVGVGSYSFYLVHSPILALTNLLLLPFALPVGTVLAVQVLVGVPVSGLVALAFFQLVERRFLNSHQKQVRLTPKNDLRGTDGTTPDFDTQKLT